MSVVESAREQLLSSGSWSVDPAHSTVEFRVKHMMIQTVHGRFRDFEGMIGAGDDPSVVGSIKVASLETLNDERDAHLRSPDFFDVEHFPEISFHSVAMHFDRDGRHFALPGELTIKGVTRPVAISASISEPNVDPFGRERVGITLEATVDRNAFGVSWNAPNQGGGNYLGDDVTIKAELALVRQDD